MDHGWHAFYLMLYLIGEEPRAVSAVLRHERGLAVEDAAECTIRFRNCTARLHLTWNAAERKSYGVVRGGLGSVDIDDSSLTVRLNDRSPETTRFAPPISTSSYHPEWFSPLLEDFRTEVLHPDQRGRSLAEAVCCAELMTAAYASKGETLSLWVPSEGT
jgi:predicted dehydrogenase